MFARKVGKRSSMPIDRGGTSFVADANNAPLNYGSFELWRDQGGVGNLTLDLDPLFVCRLLSAPVNRLRNSAMPAVKVANKLIYIQRYCLFFK